MKSNYKNKITYNGVETQLADCAVCMLHTYIAHDDFQSDFLHYPNKQDKLLLPYVEAYLDGQDRELRTIGRKYPNYSEMLAAFSRSILMMYAYEAEFKSTMDKISAHNEEFNKSFPNIEQARIILVQYAKLFYEKRMEAENHHIVKS